MVKKKITGFSCTCPPSWHLCTSNTEIMTPWYMPSSLLHPHSCVPCPGEERFKEQASKPWGRRVTVLSWKQLTRGGRKWVCRYVNRKPSCQCGCTKVTLASEFPWLQGGRSQKNFLCGQFVLWRSLPLTCCFPLNVPRLRVFCNLILKQQLLFCWIFFFFF